MELESNDNIDGPGSVELESNDNTHGPGSVILESNDGKDLLEGMEEISEEDEAAMEEDQREGFEERSVSSDVEESDVTEPMKNGLSTEVRGRGRKFFINYPQQ